MKKTIAWLLVLLLCLPVMAGAEDVIKIGIFEPMTGSYAGGGEMEMEGFSLSNELYPEVLKMKAELVVGDSKSDKVEASNAAASLVNSGVLAVLGSYSSGLSMSGADVFAEAGIPALTANSTDPAAIRDALFATKDFVGAAGPITLNETHDAVRPVVFKQLAEDGVASFLAIIEP